MRPLRRLGIRERTPSDHFTTLCESAHSLNPRDEDCWIGSENLILCMCNSGFCFLCAQQFTGWVYINQPPFLCILNVEIDSPLILFLMGSQHSKSTISLRNTVLLVQLFFPYWDFSQIFLILYIIIFQEERCCSSCDGRQNAKFGQNTLVFNKYIYWVCHVFRKKKKKGEMTTKNYNIKW